MANLQELSFLPNSPDENEVLACARVDEEEDPGAKAGEDKDPTANAGDRQIENPTLEDDIEAGPIGEQIEVVVQNQQAVCGGDNPPELSEYERLRERNIKERNEAMKEAMEEIDEAKEDMRVNAPGAKKRAAEEEDGGRKRRKKVEPVLEVRRSGRERQPVSYVVEEYLDGRSRRRGRMTGGERRKGSKTPVRSARGKAVSMQDTPPTLSSSSRTLRPRKLLNYSEVPEPEADSFIWCSTCNKVEYNGCEEHVTYFGDNKEFRLEVEKSSTVGKKAGDGVVNRGEVVPEGVLFGPYSGMFIPAAEYENIKATNMESGNAWEIRDKFNQKIVGYIDAGVNPDPQLHWMAKINCPNTTLQQNLVGFQLAGQIYYRVLMDIPYGRELLVWYGDPYAKEIGIDVKTMDRYKGKEDHTKVAVRCDYCLIGVEGEEELVKHLGKGAGTMYKCGVKQAKEMIRMVKSGERKFVCEVCGKGFKEKRWLSQHGAVHSKVKAFQCNQDGCEKRYSSYRTLLRHKQSSHEGRYYECPECGKRFPHKFNMSVHFKEVHGEEKPFKCIKCGVQFSRKPHLLLHIKDVHEKIRAFKCELCGKSFARANTRKIHMEGVHSHIRYPCTWQGCSHQAHTKPLLKYHVRRAHTKEWSLECQLCENQLNIWWGCILPYEMKKHKARKHPVEWEEEQEAYRKDHPFICKFQKCLNRYKTNVEKERHEVKMH